MYISVNIFKVLKRCVNNEKILAYFLVFIMCFGMTINVSATEKNINKVDDGKTIVMIPEKTEISDKFIDENLVGSNNSSIISRSGPYGETRQTSYEYVNKTVRVRPDKQGEWGIRGDDPGEHTELFLFLSGGNSTKFTFTAHGELFTFSVEHGVQSTEGIGISKELIEDPNHYYVLEFIKSYRIEVKKTDVYKYGIYQYSYYEKTPTLLWHDSEWVMTR